MAPLLGERALRETPAPQEPYHVHGLRLVRLAPRGKGLMVLATAVALLGVSSCAKESAPLPREPGCVTPANEDTLLDVYAADPILAFVPDRARRTMPVRVGHGCLRWPTGDVTQTLAATIFDLSGDYDRAGVRAAFAGVTAEHGWAPDRLRQATLDQFRRSQGPDMGPFLAYCRQIRGVTTEASITVQPDARGVGPHGRVTNGQMAVWTAADPQRANCQTQVSDPHKSDPHDVLVVP